MADRSQRLSLQQDFVVPMTIPQGLTIKKYKSFFQLVAMSLILSISALIFGYSLTQISCVNMTDLQGPFDIQMNLLTAQGLLTGTMPVGGIFGGLANGILLKMFTRRTAHFVVGIICIIGTALCQIPILGCLFAGRFVVGIACGVYTAIAPVYIKQIAPKQIKAQLGSFFYVGKVGGIVISYLLGLIFIQQGVSNYWRYIFMMPGLLSVIQMIGIIFFIPHSPVQMIQRQDLRQSKLILEKIYESIYVDQVMDQMIADYKAQIAKTQRMQGVGQLLGQVKSYRKNRYRALIMAIHVAILRQFIGINFVITYVKDILTPFNKTTAEYSPLVINVVQLIGTFFAVTLITKFFGRRALFNFSVVSMALANFGMAVSLIFDSVIPCLVLMNIYTFINGSTLGAVAWAYPAQIIPPSKQPYVTLVSWISISIVTIFPPIIIQHLPNENSYPLFLFFGFWGLWSFFYDWFCLVQTKGRSYEQVIQQF